jgi:hypothetical protein
MTPTRPAGLGLRVWMSLGMALITLLILAVALGLLSQSSAPPTATAPPRETATSSLPGTRAGGSGAPPTDMSAIVVAGLLCQKLPAALTAAAQADTPAEAGELAGAAALLSQGINAVADAASAEDDERWTAALAPGRTAVDQWKLAAGTPLQQPAYDRGRRSGIRQAQRMQARLAALGVTDCRFASSATP